VETGSESKIEIPFLGSRQRLRELSEHLVGSGYQVWLAPSLSEMLLRYQTTELQGALIAEDHFTGGTWREILAVLDGCEDAPYLVVLSDFCADKWVQMYEAGVFDVLTHPLSAERLLQCLTVAQGRWRHRKEKARLQEQSHIVLDEYIDEDLKRLADSSRFV